jgi:hypothetical protein
MTGWMQWDRVPRGALAVVILASVAALWPGIGGNTPVLASVQAPSCTVGTWAATDLQSALQAFTEGVTAGLTINRFEGGELVLTIEPDGTYEAQYSDVMFSATVSGFNVGGTLSGTVSGAYRQESPGMLVGTVTDGTVNVTISVFGQQMSTSFAVPAGEGAATSYECDGDRLTLAISNPFGGAAATVVFMRVP